MGNLFSSCLLGLKAFGHTTPRVCANTRVSAQSSPIYDSPETTSNSFNSTKFVVTHHETEIFEYSSFCNDNDNIINMYLGYT